MVHCRSQQAMKVLECSVEWPPVQGMALDSTELREYTNGMLGHLAEALGEDFTPFLPSAVQAAIASCSQVRRSPIPLFR